VSRVNIHATGLVLDGVGVLLRGPSGAGKSLLALELLDEWEARGRAARLVADDRLDLERRDDMLVMHAPPAIAGLAELRGRGVVRRPFAPAAPLHLVVDLVDSLERMPEETAFTTQIEGIALPRCPVPRRGVVDGGHQALLIREALRALGANLGRGKKIP
jgi:serine kinase of HPr protein (carbohydrate metabolism regulator)